MTMKMITAKDQFDYAVWKVLDGIEMQRLLHQNKKVIDYIIDIDIRNLAQTHFHNVMRFLKDSKVIKEVNKPDLVEIGTPGTPEYKVHEVYHFKLLSKYNGFYKSYSNSVNGEVDTSELFGFDDETFWLKTVNGEEAKIDFSPKGNRKYPTQQYYLLKAFIQLLKTGKWERNGYWIEIKITQKQILDKVRKLNYNDPDKLNSAWISNARNNLVNKSLPASLENFIKISPYEVKSQTYTFALKIPS